jgi:hypothetical protein
MAFLMASPYRQGYFLSFVRSFCVFDILSSFRFSFFRWVSIIATSDYYCRYVCPSAATGRIFRESLDLNIFRKYFQKIQVSLKFDKHTCIPIYFLIISRSVLLRMRNVSDKTCRQNHNITFIFNISLEVVPFVR